jgi:hypothetical protein
MRNSKPGGFRVGFGERPESVWRRDQTRTLVSTFRRPIAHLVAVPALYERVLPKWPRMVLYRSAFPGSGWPCEGGRPRP